MRFFLLLLILEASVAQTDPPPEKCFNEAIPKYVTCRPVHGRPAACNCRNIDPCYIKLIITRKRKIDPTEANNYTYFVNGTFQGPTIIAEEKGIVVVDVFNDMDEDTSMHFHGMHQHNVPWIDGVGNITQYPIPANGKFRYIFRAFPQGTHWYHSHMRYQRDAGLFGALVVHESQRDIHERLGPFIDEPDKYLLTLLESLKNVQPSGKPDPFCLPDGSKLPIQYDRVSFFLNGKEIAKDILGRRANESHSEYFVVPGQKYRFRVLGATKSNILVISIDYHKLHVIATDGYLVNKFTTDFLIVHVGERYDFILEAKKGIKPGTKYPINIQTLAVKCDNNSEVAGLSFAFVVYTDKSGSKNVPTTIAQQSDRCSNALSPCKILNCPFLLIPTDFINDGTYMTCYNVRELRLLYPTPERDIPSSSNISQLSFFNFEVIWPKALINGVQFYLPDIPLVENTGTKQECIYPVDCKEPGSKYCTHTVYLNNFGTTTRFVLSSIITQGKQDPVDITHPIHMHGHTYFIAKIAYPDYYDNGTIKAPNEDLTVPKCGPASWRGSTPGGITVDRTTVRKDVIIVPAGGYVVLEFLADNPGYWFMHCHIDQHLNRGMALAIGEAPSCASSPPTPLLNETDEFCFSVDTFKAKEREANGKCRRAIAAPSLGRIPTISAVSFFAQLFGFTTALLFLRLI